MTIFKAYSALFRQGDRLIEITVMIMSRARWERSFRDNRPGMVPLAAGPLVVAIGVRE